MEDLTQLIEHVKQNPDDHNQRWRLAKKLYGNWEYRMALDHLKKLKEAWPNQQNVIHYLATTHYRVGNYDEAISELQALLEIYPSDGSVWRLLGRICESANRPADAKKAYREAMICSPSTSLVKAVERLDGVDESRSSIADISAYDEITPDKTQITCRYCGSANDAFLERCVQCHESLAVVDAVESSSAPAPAKPRVVRDEEDEFDIPPNRMPMFVLLGVMATILLAGVLLAAVVF